MKLRTFQRELDNVLDNEHLKEQFKKNKLFLSAVKSFVKKEWKSTHHMMENFHNLDYMKLMREIRRCWFPNGENTYYYRSIPYIIKDPWEVFFKEYLEQLLNGYENYCYLTGIQKHLQKVINT